MYDVYIQMNCCNISYTLVLCTVVYLTTSNHYNVLLVSVVQSFGKVSHFSSIPLNYGDYLLVWEGAFV